MNGDPQARFGADLRLLADLQRQYDRSGGSDLLVTSGIGPGTSDPATLRDVENLQQALLLRFLTRQGELTPLGHPDYGSRLYTLIGELNNDINRNLAKLFVLEALGAEPRVQAVTSVDVTAGARDRIDIRVTITTIDHNTPLNLVFPFYLGAPG